MEENKNVNNPENNKPAELSPEIREALKKNEEVTKKFAEIFAQCWDDEEFKKKFMENPEQVMDEFGVEYDKSKDYIVVDSKPKTVTYILPYENVKAAMNAVGDAFKNAAGNGSDTRKVMPEGWSMEFIQNSADANYIVIPHNPEKLTPEELEMINGGFILGPVFIVAAAVLIFLGAVVQSAAVATSVVVAAEVAAVAIGVTMVTGSQPAPTPTQSIGGTSGSNSYGNGKTKVY